MVMPALLGHWEMPCTRQLCLSEAGFFIRKTPWLSGKSGQGFAESKVYSACFYSAFYPRRLVSETAGNESVGCFFHADSQKASECVLQDRNYFSDPDHDRNVYPGALFLSVPVPDGSCVCNNADFPVSIVSQRPLKMSFQMRRLQETLPCTS